MKKFSFRSVLPLICTFSILVSLAVGSASAAWDSTRDVRDDESVSDIQACMTISSGWSATLFKPLLEKLGFDASVSAQKVAWSLIDTAVNGGGLGEVSLATLNQLAAQYTSYFNGSPADNFVLQIVSGTGDVLRNALCKIVFNKMSLTFEVRSWGTSGFMRIYCPDLDIFVTSSTGRYAYANEAHLESSGGDRWVTLSTMSDRNVKYHSLSELQLKQTASELGYKPTHYDNYWIIKKAGAGTQDWVFADKDGQPYVAPYDKNQTATSTTRPTTSVKDENGEDVEVPENSSSNIDLSGMTVTLPDGTFNFIDQLIYDESTKTYYIDSHDTYTVNNNNYTTNYYSWTYHINYTSITYIGQTEEYNKYYEVYYELPDGRDSADLTKEEVEQLNVSVDVIPYGRSADDTSLRSLYHFDGDTRDSSYWNYCTDFTWNKGASLTYMDSGVFEGALYLDETEHDFTLTLPSSLGSGDFTLQFRYYQSHTEAPQTDSYIQVGSTIVLKMNGSSLLSGDGTVLASVPVGSWNEVALIRESNVCFFYLNGVCVAQNILSSYLSNEVTFHFGAEQQTYKYLDELRVLNFALVEDGDNYECTSVPYDTNLTLVLPDSSVPVADEYWDVTFSDDSTVALDFTNYQNSDLFVPKSYGSASVSAVGEFDGSYLFVSGAGTVSVRAYNNLDASGGSFSNISNYLNYYTLSCGADLTATKGATPISFTMLLSDGTSCSGRFIATYDGSDWLCVDYSGNDLYGSVAFEFDDFYLCFSRSGTRYYPILIPDQSIDGLGVMAFAMSVGDTYSSVSSCPVLAYPVLEAELVTSVTAIDSADLNTLTLAVRTDLDITSYQIGGVRPSLPSKGQVWCLVESERITSIQIYNGSAWEGVDGRIWTGERWIPASSYNIITLQDMYDIADATQDFEYIYSESGFWTWWQKSWNAFTEKLFSVLGGSSGAASGGSGASELQGVDLDAVDPDADPDEEASKSLWQFVVLVISGGKSVVGGTRELFSGVVSTIPDTMDQIVGAFDPGGIAVGALDGTSSDPDAADLPADPDAVSAGSEVLDPWRYR